MIKYTYLPLDNVTREIRLLDLLPGQGPIKCQLRTEILEGSTHGSYEALSYCWGPPSSVQVEIIVDERSLFITPNLYIALLRLRNNPLGGPRTLWIDAICIDQGNLSEKSFQIPLMRDIYSFCRRVVIWVGEHDAMTEAALEGIEYMASKSGEGKKFNYYDWKKTQRNDNGNAKSLRRFVPLSSQAEVLTSAASITSFFSRPWFTRVWVIQEVTLSPEAVVVCGKYEIDWDRIVRADQTSRTNFEHDLGTLRRFRNWPKEISHDLLNRMIMAWHKSATNPRDKIFGLMGLENSALGEGLIEVDYQKSLVDIFTSFTKAYLKKTGNLQALVLCRGCKAVELAEKEYPSWAVDYRFSRARESLPESLISWGFEDWKVHPRGLSAGGQNSSELIIVDNALGVRGLRFDAVTTMSVVKAPSTTPDWREASTGKTAYLSNPAHFYPTFIGSLFGAWTSAIDSSRFYVQAKEMCNQATPDGMYHPTKQIALEAFWQILRGREMPIDQSEEMASTRTLFEDVDRLLTGQTGKKSLLGPIASLTLATVKELRLLSFFAQVGIAKQRRFLVTREGYMGLGPREMQVGDEILVLQGHGAPVVARQTDDGRWRVVGESYIHGIMEGEAFHEHECDMLWFI